MSTSQDTPAPGATGAPSKGFALRHSARWLPVAGIVTTLILWQIVINMKFLGEDFSSGFTPIATFKALCRLTATGEIWRQLLPSLKRICVGLAWATVLGFFIGVIIGINRSIERFTYTTFQFIRMISPLAWMPLAIIVWGIGDKPIYFLIAIAAVWPITMEIHVGVRCVNPLWISVVQMLGGSQWDVLRKIIIPAIVPHILTGLKLAIGIAWIILVPAEMLGVSSGLGYYILDCRDRFSYDEMMAIIMVIGLIGLILDSTITLILSRLHWSESD